MNLFDAPTAPAEYIADPAVLEANRRENARLTKRHIETSLGSAKKAHSGLTCSLFEDIKPADKRGNISLF